MIEPSIWNEMRGRAASGLSGDFSSRVLRRAADERRKRAELSAAATTLALCLSATAAIAGWRAHEEHQTNLAQWRELAAVTSALEQSL